MLISFLFICFLFSCQSIAQVNSKDTTPQVTQNSSSESLANSKQKEEVEVVSVSGMVKRYGLIAFSLHFALFTLLFIGARFSPWPWRVMSDPVFGKIGLWYWVLIRYSPKTHLFVLARWFENTSLHTQEASYLPMAIHQSNANKCFSNTLLDEFNPSCRLWILGRAGMGKTALFSELRHIYFKRESSLTKKYDEFGYIPIFITLREYADVVIPKKTPEDWLIEIIAREMEYRETAFSDVNLLKNLLKSGRFILILDGENEVNHKGALNLFSKRFPEIGLVVLSQSSPTSTFEKYEIWSLPSEIKIVAKDLISLYLGQPKGQEVFDAIRQTAILNNIQSGYDIRLLTDLVEGGTVIQDLPHTRTGLFDAMLAKVDTKDGSRYDIEALCRATWDLWSSGKRTFFHGERLTEELIAPLHSGKVRIVRILDGERWQFTHDEMRGYLTAAWAAKFEVSPIDLFERSPEIWRVSQSDQKLVWLFFSEMLDDVKHAKIIDWASLDPQKSQLHSAMYCRPPKFIHHAEDDLPLQQVEELSIFIGYGLINLFTGDVNFDMSDRLKKIRLRIYEDLGVLVPSIRIRDNMQLGQYEYQISIRNTEVARLEVQIDCLLAIHTNDVIPKELVGKSIIEPSFGLNAIWIDESEKEKAERLRFTVVDIPVVIMTHLLTVLKQHLKEFLSFSKVERLVGLFPSQHNRQLQEAIKKRGNPTIICSVLKKLVDQGVSIRDLSRILEAIWEAIEKDQDVEFITEQVRKNMSLALSTQHAQSENTIHAFTLSKKSKALLDTQIKNCNQLDEFKFSEGDFLDFKDRVYQLIGATIESNNSPIILVDSGLRPFVQKISTLYLENIPILSYDEIHKSIATKTLAEI